MTLLAVERIKLFSTRSPFWCAAAALVIAFGLTTLFTANSGPEFPVTIATTQFPHGFVITAIMVMAALAITTEYRFGTIRVTFQAVPERKTMLLAKTVVVALLAGVIGWIAAFGSWGIATLIKPSADLALNSGQEWRNVAGVGVLCAVAAVLALAIGILVRHSAGAISVLLIYSVVIEPLIQVIPKVGADIYRWMPFNVGERFLSAGAPPQIGDEGPPGATSTLGPWWALAYFAGIAVAFLIAALFVADRRDA